MVRLSRLPPTLKPHLCDPFTKKPKIRPANLHEDQYDLVGIDHAVFESVWTSEQFRAFKKNGGNILVFEHERRVLGYVCYEEHHRFIFLTRIAVSPAWQRSGIGSALVQKLKDRLNYWHRRTLIRCVVSEYNLAGQLFMRDGCGFTAKQILHDAYEDIRADGLVFDFRQMVEPHHIGSRFRSNMQFAVGDGAGDDGVSGF